MHLIFWVHGQKGKVDELIKWLETRMCMLYMEDTKTGKNYAKPVQAALRYSIYGTFELIIPETSKDQFLSDLNFGKKPRGQSIKNKLFKKLGMDLHLSTIRKAIGAKKAPKFEKKEEHPILPRELFENIRIIPIGVRYDEIKTDEKGLKYEHL